MVAQLNLDGQPIDAGSGNTYAVAGVNISDADRVVKAIKPICERTFDPNVITGVGPFAPAISLKVLRDLDIKNPWQAMLVPSTDGPGTLPSVAKTARLAGVRRTLVPVAYSTAQHCFADIACTGARPCLLMNNISDTEMDLDEHVEIVEGLVIACEEFEPCVKLPGGECAQLGSIIQPGQIDFSVTVVGFVDQTEHINPHERIRPGDIFVGIGSGGPELNGISLIRKILRDLEIKITDQFAPTGGTVAEVLLDYQPNFASAVHMLLDASARITGAANITGGGLFDNQLRNLPANCRAIFDPASWRPAPIFPWLVEQGQVELVEAYHTWNMGLGYVLSFPSLQMAESAVDLINDLFEDGNGDGVDIGASIIGRIEEGKQGVEIVGVGSNEADGRLYYPDGTLYEG